MKRGWSLCFILWKSEDTEEFSAREENELIYKYGHYEEKGVTRGQGCMAVEVVWRTDAGGLDEEWHWGKGEKNR